MAEQPKPAGVIVTKVNGVMVVLSAPAWTRFFNEPTMGKILGRLQLAGASAAGMVLGSIGVSRTFAITAFLTVLLGYLAMAAGRLLVTYRVIKPAVRAQADDIGLMAAQQAARTDRLTEFINDAASPFMDFNEDTPVGAFAVIRRDPQGFVGDGGWIVQMHLNEDGADGVVLTPMMAGKTLIAAGQMMIAEATTAGDR